MDCKKHFALVTGLLLLLLASSCQKAYQLELDFALNRDKLRFTNAEGQSYFLVYSQGDWTVSLPEGTSWISLNRTQGNGNQQVTVYCRKNTRTSRGAYVTVTNHDGAVKQVYVSQEGAIDSPHYTFGIQANGLHGLSALIEVPVDTDLDAESIAQAELKVEGEWIHDVTFSETQLSFRVDAHSGAAAREGSITLSFPAAEWDSNRCVAELTVRQSPDAPRLELNEFYTLDPEGANPTAIPMKGNFEPALYPELDFSTWQLGTDSWMNSVVYDPATCSLVVLPQRNDSNPRTARSTGLTCFLKNASGTILDQAYTLLKQEAADEHYDYSTAVRLGTAGVGANCFLVENVTGGKYFVDALHVDGTPIADAVSAAVLWQTEENLIQYPLLQNGKCYFTVDAAKKGNTILNLRNASNKSVWTLHIWVAGEAVGSRKLDGKVFMDRNLGALAATAPTATESDAAGLHYQWGRKDPFPTAADYVTTGNRDHKAVYPASAISINKAQDGQTAAWVLQHPGYYIMGTSGGSGAEDWIDTQDDNLWGGESGVKANADPCPQGWKVPRSSDISSAALTRIKAGAFAAYGVSLPDDDGADLYIPASGVWRRTFADASEMANVGKQGWWWTASSGTVNTNFRGGIRLVIQSSTARTLDSQPRRWGASVRCVKE